MMKYMCTKYYEYSSLVYILSNFAAVFYFALNGKNQIYFTQPCNTMNYSLCNSNSVDQN